MKSLANELTVAMYKDSQGMPRAWAISIDRIQAEASAKLELEAYQNEKTALGDPLAIDTFTLEVITLTTTPTHMSNGREL
jgi:hypothetical protein